MLGSNARAPRTLISAPEDYAAGAKHWRVALRAKLGPPVATTSSSSESAGGNSLSHLTGELDVTGVESRLGSFGCLRKVLEFGACVMKK